MSNSLSEKLKIIFQLLTERNLTIISIINNELKCIICKKLMINACQTVCGCNFCKECIETYRNNGGGHCPGGTDVCEWDDLSNITMDNKTNLRISRLIVRCDMESCCYECELIDMDKHLEQCLTKKNKCLFNDEKSVEEENNFIKINEILQKEYNNQSELYLEMVNKIRCEIKDLKENTKIYNDKIINIMKHLSMNDNEIVNLRENFQRMKDEKEKQEIEIENLKEIREKEKNELIILKNNLIESEKEIHLLKSDIENYKNKLKDLFEKTKTNESQIEIFNENKMEIKKEIENLLQNETVKEERINSIEFKTDLVKTENERIIENIELMKNNFENKINEIFLELNSKFKNKIIASIKEDIKLTMTDKDESERKAVEEKKRHERELKLKVNQLEKYLDLRYGIFIWHIGIIDRLYTNQCQSSEYFYGINHFYKLGLRLVNYDDALEIELLIYNGEMDPDLKWPFHENVTIKVVNKIDQNKNKSLTKKCLIGQSVKGRCQCSDVFSFTKSNLFDIGISTNYSDCAIECSIDFVNNVQ